jgi:SAM-dependent methyltransferase
MYMAETIFLILLLFTFYGLARGSASLAPWVPTKRRDYKRLKLLLDELNPKSFIDIGCGTAGQLIYQARNKPDIQFVGIEIALPLFVIAWVKSYFSGCKNIRIIYGDLFHKTLTEYDVIYVYGYPRSIKKRLTEKIVSEAKPGSYLISYVFRFHELDLFKVDKPDKSSLALNIYKL